MFTPSKMLQKYMSVQPRDMFGVVGALIGYINADPQFKTNEFEQAIQYVLNNGFNESELFAEFDESLLFETDPSKWDEEYYSFARVYLKDNFCRKRIDHVKAVAKKLYPVLSEPDIMPQTDKPAVQISAQTGGTQSNGKKIQSQQSQQSGNDAMPTKLIMIVVVVILLAVVIVKLLTK
jgi:hypothetical protein